MLPVDTVLVVVLLGRVRTYTQEVSQAAQGKWYPTQKKPFVFSSTEMQVCVGLHSMYEALG